MRWQPTVDRCPECAFDWHCDLPDAAVVVTSGPSEVEEALLAVPSPTARNGDTWSASMYVWHLVDVLRIGTERLLTLSLDPTAGVPCWDETALASVRKYELLSPTVGVDALRLATRDWQEALRSAPAESVVEHAEFGSLGVVDVVRRNPHEVHHHIGDIRRRQVL